MARPAIVVVFAALALLPGAIRAQTPEPDAPTAGPNEVVYTGVVPAPPGTEVTAQFVIPPSWDFVVCATGTTTAIEGEDSGRSAFALVVDAECVLGSPVEAKFCWGEDRCYLPLRLRPVGWPLREDELVRQVSLGVMPSWPGGPNDVVYIGEVPAPPGTEIAGWFLVSEATVCGTATTTPVPGGGSDRSGFVLVLDYDCMYGSSFGPGICWGEWGEGPCYPYMMPGNAPRPGPGEMADLGLLPLPQSEEPQPPPPDFGPDVERGTPPAWVPAAGPDEVVFAGLIRAPAGTEITVYFMDTTSPSFRVVDCATATTTVIPGGEPSGSRFVLVVEEQCMSGPAPKFCWGEIPCWMELDMQYTGLPAGGTTVYLGLIPPPRQPGDPNNPALPHGDRGPDTAPPPTGTGLLHAGSGPDIVLPDTGSRRSPDHGHWAIWLAWATAGLLGAGFAFAALGAAVRRRL